MKASGIHIAAISTSMIEIQVNINIINLITLLKSEKVVLLCVSLWVLVVVDSSSGLIKLPDFN